MRKKHETMSDVRTTTRPSGGARGTRQCEQPFETKRLKVLLAGKLTAMAAPGGAETQLAALARALPRLDIDARPWRPWEEPLEADCLHLVGSEPGHLEMVEAAHRRGIPVVLSSVAWFDLACCWREEWPIYRRLWSCGKFAARAAIPRLPSWRRTLYQAVDLILPNSRTEALQLVRYFGVPADRMQVVFNGAEADFRYGDPAPFARLVGDRGFVLYAGRIEPRKNQLGFLKAMAGLDVPVVILGSVVPGHESYLARCRRAAGARVRFVERIDRAGPLLASAYAACGCLVLASWFETPGLVALEAGMSGTPLVLPAGGCAREYFGPHAAYVAPGDLAAIRRETLAALERGRDERLSQLVQQNYTWQAAAAATRDAYLRVCPGWFQHGRSATEN